MTNAMTLRITHDTVAGSAAVFPCRRRLQPAGSESNKVPSLPFARTVYAVAPQRPTLSPGKARLWDDVADRCERVNHRDFCHGMLSHAQREGYLQRGALHGF